MQPALEYRFKQVAHYYGTHRALEIKSLDIAKGSITGLAGPNGSGKSTLLKLMTFAEQPTRGEILFNGKQGQLFSPNVRFKISLLTQKPYLLKRTVYDNTAYGLKIRGTRDNLKAKVSDALLKVGLTFDGFAQRQWHELSGGEAQRVALAARLALRPQVLLLDEPTASVDLESAQLIRQAAFAARNEWGTTLVIASHDRQWLDEISETTLHLFNGKIMKPGIHTMVTGPWTRQNNGLFSTPLGNGQLFIAPVPPEKDALGLIDNLDIHVEVERPANSPKTPDHCDPINGSGFTNRLKGIVTHLMLDQKASRIAVTIQVGDFIFTPRLDREMVASLALYPGSHVIISVDSNHLTWL
ncbi:HTH-type transcriptional regulator [Desulforapulum autotrophicum HRM2]|uniref:HTH-type transcriptional regulator n=1 Tax=Desulforapulum autotrophicum (strain ATCC 43914 / DSM 3382 / VKM B-1955 / HRM2) TaxID=177437 RepID=C0QB65_DESAH|nr:ATP-binding cassette domain-containing protein [Desulforapulum autotrophicum]ACN14864.1 HTH-type transcriptional regulator [Desulforapulum autotrophicum HRM2]